MLTWENCADKTKAFFVAEKDAFANSARGLSWLKDQASLRCRSSLWLNLEIEIVLKNIAHDDDFLFEDLLEFKKFINSKILVVGGGPTTNEIDWDINDYDYVFSCNHFYKSKKLKDKKVDLFFVGNEVDTNEEAFLNYCRKYNPIIGIEDLQYRQTHVKNLVSNFPKNTFFCSCRYQSKLTGITSKLILLALTLKAKHVDFVGLDGVPADFYYLNKIPHGFEGKKLFRKNKISHYEQVKEQYLFFDKYIKESFPNTTINNLGKNSKFNYAYEKNI